MSLRGASMRVPYSFGVVCRICTFGKLNSESAFVCNANNIVLVASFLIQLQLPGWIKLHKLTPSFFSPLISSQPLQHSLPGREARGRDGNPYSCSRLTYHPPPSRRPWLHLGETATRKAHVILRLLLARRFMVNNGKDAEEKLLSFGCKWH